MSLWRLLLSLWRLMLRMVLRILLFSRDFEDGKSIIIVTVIKYRHELKDWVWLLNMLPIVRIVIYNALVFFRATGFNIRVILLDILRLLVLVFPRPRFLIRIRIFFSCDSFILLGRRLILLGWIVFFICDGILICRNLKFIRWGVASVKLEGSFELLGILENRTFIWLISLFLNCGSSAVSIFIHWSFALIKADCITRIQMVSSG